MNEEMPEIPGLGEVVNEPYENIIKSVDDELKRDLTPEQYMAWSAVEGTEEEEERIIGELGEDRYYELLDQVSKILSEKLKKLS